MIKIIPTPAQCGMVGFESPATEYKQDDLCLTKVLIQHPEASYACFAQGDSMIGEGIFSGDLLIISRAETVKDKDIIVANLNGVFICKKIDIKKQLLLSSGADLPSYKIQEEDEFQVEGVVISSVRMHREFKKSLE
jgi:DNA polymerase V